MAMVLLEYVYVCTRPSSCMSYERERSHRPNLRKKRTTPEEKRRGKTALPGDSPAEKQHQNGINPKRPAMRWYRTFLLSFRLPGI